jgi:hypothetical protein
LNYQPVINLIFTKLPSQAKKIVTRVIVPCPTNLELPTGHKFNFHEVTKPGQNIVTRVIIPCPTNFELPTGHKFNFHQVTKLPSRTTNHVNHVNPVPTATGITRQQAQTATNPLTSEHQAQTATNPTTSRHQA